MSILDNEIFELTSKISLLTDPTTNQIYIKYLEENGGETALLLGGLEANCLLRKLAMELYSKISSSNDLKRISEVLQTLATINCQRQSIYKRAVKIGKVIYINHGLGRVIKITSEGVYKKTTSDVIFEKTDNLNPLPNPDRNLTNLELLRKYITVNDDDFILILVFIFNCYFTDTHFLILFLSGPAGSGKSTAQEVIKQLVDPTKDTLRNKNQSLDDFIIALRHCHLLSLNNISKLSNDQQDALCTTLTGGVTGKRALYSDLTQTLIHLHNPVIINGIGDIITRDDLNERTINIQLKKFRDDTIRSEKKLKMEFEQDYPKILGGIYEALTQILKYYDSYEPEGKLPRMVDFHILGCVCENALSWKKDKFSMAYRRNLNLSYQNIIDNSEIGRAIVDLINQEDKFIGTKLQLLDKLTSQLSGKKPTPRALSNEIDRLSGALFKIHGISIKKFTSAHATPPTGLRIAVPTSLNKRSIW